SRHAKARDKRECDRIKAVLLRSEGWSLTMISQALRKSEATITRYIGDYSVKMKLKPAGGGSSSHLNIEQTKQLIAHLSEFTYQHTHQIVAYVKATWAIAYSVSGMNKWLHQHGFSYKQPKGVPHKFDEKKQAAFIDAYASLRDALSEDESIIFMDAVHPTQATKMSCGWIKKGVDKPVATTGSRTRMNLIGGIELGQLDRATVQDYDTINSDTICAFFDELKAKYPPNHTLHLILDGAGYHR
ncbi:IS630 family transposase, partial [Agaribacter flavus]